MTAVIQHSWTLLGSLKSLKKEGSWTLLSLWRQSPLIQEASSVLVEVADVLLIVCVITTAWKETAAATYDAVSRTLQPPPPFFTPIINEVNDHLQTGSFPPGTLLFLELKKKKVERSPLSFFSQVFETTMTETEGDWEAAQSCSPAAFLWFLSVLFRNNSPGFKDIKMSALPFGPTLLQ